MAAGGDTAQPGAPARRVGVLSLGMWWRVPHLRSLLGSLGTPVWLSGLVRPPPRVTAIVGWGRKAPAQRARRLAERWGLPFVTAEDGFLRSVGLGVAGTPPLSIVLDSRGVHYEAQARSDIEAALQNWHAIPAADLAMAGQLLDLMRRHAIGKYNDAPDLDDADPTGRDRPLVLVVDQTVGDASIAGGGVDAATFEAMLAAARAENPGADIRVKIHPDVLAGRRQGFLLDSARQQGIALEAREISWPSLARRAARVYVATSLAGFEALIQGVPVVCFGLPFYAGWGLTDDRQAVARRTARPSLEAVVAAAYVGACRYIDPLTGRPGSALDVARYIARVKHMDREFAGHTVVVGLRPWKHERTRRFLASRWGRVAFVNHTAKAVRRARREGGRIAVWAARAPADLAAACAAAGVPLWRIEDGFLRSVGLGSDHVAAASLVVDREGIYFDPTGPSELETLLEAGGFDAGLLAEAARLRRTIVERGLTKYNVGRAQDVVVDGAAGRRRILVPGQVEDDASVRLGAPGVGGNRGLLEAVRAACPDAWIVYKPHPDVEAGNRQGAIPAAVALTLADQIVVDTSVVRLFDLVDEVHTMTSLVGFEALVRGLAVTTYGLPFYAGWGLTTDRQSAPRRRRRLTLDELVAGALIGYPRYADPQSGLPCDVWHVVNLLSGGTPRGTRSLRQRGLRGLRLAGALLQSLSARR
ncbi:capsular polysaccharide biosynthesis protein [Oleomonas cavernae]|nr:capsular polysaccharide biosynthesis protein [Oleomonas cavernae]